MTEAEYVPQEIICPYCNRAGGHIEWVLSPKRRYRGQWLQNEIGIHVPCFGCHGLGKIIDPNYFRILEEKL